MWSAGPVSSAWARHRFRDSSCIVLCRRPLRGNARRRIQPSGDVGQPSQDDHHGRHDGIQVQALQAKNVPMGTVVFKLANEARSRTTLRSTGRSRRSSHLGKTAHADGQVFKKTAGMSTCAPFPATRSFRHEGSPRRWHGEGPDDTHDHDDSDHHYNHDDDRSRVCLTDALDRQRFDDRVRIPPLDDECSLRHGHLPGHK